MDPRTTKSDASSETPSSVSPSSSPDSPLKEDRSRSLGSVWQQTLNSRTAVLGTLFLVTGAIGLPLVWYSPVFTRIEKVFWSVMAIIYTSALIGVTWAVVYWCYKLIVDAF